MSDELDSEGEVELDSFEEQLHRELAPGDTGASPPGDLPLSLDAPVEIGAFTIEELLGAGGMGAVYRGTHRETGTTVAVKVVHQPTDPEHRRRFHAEVQSHARLIHPGVVYLFEYGTVDEQTAAASGDVLNEGWPYVAMEFAERGTVRDLMPLSDWEDVYDLVIQLLDALAYAHARGVVHRDLKPENLLVFEAEPAARVDRRIKLADFGIAHAFGEEETRDTAALSSPIGTPQYMAPEQFEGAWRHYGPWTDLYGIGCMVWELVCGRPPFAERGLNFVEISLLHGEAERPPLEPEFPVPRGLEAWIRRCMAVAPRARFRRAADALWNLPRRVSSARRGAGADFDVPDRTDGDRAAATGSGASTRLPTFETTVVLETTEDREAETIPDGSDGPAPSGSTGASEAVETHMGRPPTPKSWRRERAVPLPAQIVGAGAGLFGLREPPFVDRDRERDRIWRALCRVEAEQRPRVVLIVGDSGCGKSRLVEWMLARGHELGATHTVRTAHTPGGRGLGEGVPGMVRRLVRGQKLERGEFYEHLLDELPPLAGRSVDVEADARALTELVFPTDRDADAVDGPRYQYASADQKCAVTARLLHRYSRDRPAFVWLDDAQWGDLSLTFAGHLLGAAFDQPPVLVAATLRSDVIAERDALADRVEQLAASERCIRIDLDPLSPEDHRAFVEQMLPLEEELADRLADRTEGNPLFATQLLGDVVEQRRLEVTDEGFRLPEGVQLDVPDTIHELWMRRLGRLVDALEAGPAERVWEILERTAALGREVDAREWRPLCQRAGFDRPDELRDELLDRGLAERTDEGWSFTHGLLVESLRDRARDGGRWQEHSRACAQLLEGLYADRPRRISLRLADYYVEAGIYEAALEPLRSAVKGANRSGDVRRALRILEQREAILDEIGADENDPRRLENAIEVEGFEGARGAEPEARAERLEQLAAEAEEIGRSDLASEAVLAAGGCAREAGALDEAYGCFDRGADHARRAEDPILQARAAMQLGWLEQIRGNLEASESYLEEGRDHARRAGSPYWEVYVQYGLAFLVLARGETDRARALFEKVLDCSEREGYRELGAECLNGLGDLARFAGDAERARAYYRQKRDRAREMSRPPEVATALLNLVQVELMDGRYDEAAELLSDAEQGFRETGRTEKHPDMVRIARLVLAAGTGDFTSYDELWSRYEEGWPEEARLVRDHPWLLELAGDRAREAGFGDRADDAWRVAGALWERLGDEVAVERIADKRQRA